MPYSWHFLCTLPSLGLNLGLNHCHGGGSRMPGGDGCFSHCLCRRAAHLRQKGTGMVELGSDCSLGRLGPEKEGEGQASQRKHPTHRAFLCGHEPGGAPSSSTFLLGPEAAKGPAASRGNAPGLCFTLISRAQGRPKRALSQLLDPFVGVHYPRLVAGF